MEENKLKLLMGKCKPGEYEDCFGIPLMGKYVENFPYGVATSTVHGNFLKGSYSYDRDCYFYENFPY